MIEQVPDLGYRVGDHLCAFHNGPGALNDIVVDYGELVARDGILQFFGEEEAYLPDGPFSKDASMASLRGIIPARDFLGTM